MVANVKNRELKLYRYLQLAKNSSVVTHSGLDFESNPDCPIVGKYYPPERSLTKQKQLKNSRNSKTINIQKLMKKIIKFFNLQSAVLLLAILGLSGFVMTAQAQTHYLEQTFISEQGRPVGTPIGVIDQGNRWILENEVWVLSPEWDNDPNGTPGNIFDDIGVTGYIFYQSDTLSMELVKVEAYITQLT